MKNFKTGLVVLGLSFALMAHFAVPAMAADVIKIGLASAMTGPVAFGGQTTMKAAQLAIEKSTPKGASWGRNWNWSSGIA